MKRKTLMELQKALVNETGVKMQEETEEKFQEFVSPASLDQVIQQRPSAAALLSMRDINEGEVVGASLYT